MAAAPTRASPRSARPSVMPRVTGPSRWPWSSVPTSSTTASVSPTSVRSSPTASPSSGRSRPKAFVVRWRNPRGLPDCDSNPAWWRSCSATRPASPAHSRMSRTHWWRPGGAGKGRRSRSTATRPRGASHGAIAQSADRLYLDLSPQQRDFCRSILLRLVALAPDGAPLRRRMGTRGIQAIPPGRAIIARLASARLVAPTRSRS